ncbi:hypothetical protein ACLPJG_26560 [Pseudomonas aeruginosa]|uniref:Uncharacterized protein n=2 Tax=Pseudomonas TaxID=286 RepID=A0ABD4YLN5_9PSED|nr:MULTISPECIES: hypothetical protein [Pseudomonas]MCT8191617.1 hypothetical protein [Pseudomonas monteilii]TXG98995.1 MAG: hypothetical protein E6R08_02960 [Nevskiaceae bacterium]MCF3157297.1 hypothetical protein [Pseudomonas juntendi]MDH0760476.1 hypothetical protein [Pseudomonas juntendi]MDH1917931.1 hypothetical protein [Pseudomonas juntendi]
MTERYGTDQLVGGGSLGAGDSTNVKVRMKPAARHEWIIQWIRENGDADVLNSEFVDAYVFTTGATSVALGLGADRCRQLGRDLSTLHDAQRLTRCRIGLKEHYMGMPNWVYAYSL